MPEPNEVPAPVPVPVPVPAKGMTPGDDRPERPPLLQTFPASLAITAAVVAFFLVQLAVDGAGELSRDRLGAVRRDLVLDEGELYRLFCAAFLHSGPVHIVLNGLALIQLAPLVELLWGSSRLLVVYLLSALLGCLASAVFQPLPSVGASGAILGLAGLLLGATWFGAEPFRSRLRELLGRRLLVAVLLTFGLGVGLQVSGFFPIIDNMGHLGGFVAGLGCSLLMRDPHAPPGRATRAAAALLVTLCLGAFVWMALSRPRDPLDSRLRLQASLQERSPEHPLADLLTTDLARSLAHDGQHGRAREVLERRLRAAPDAREALTQLARSLTLHEDVPEDLRGRLPGLAKRALDRADADPVQPGEELSRAELLDAIAELHRVSGDLAAASALEARAIELVERRVAATPEDPDALNALAWFLVTRADPALNDPHRAEPLARAAVALREGAGALFGEDRRRADLAGKLDTMAEVLFQLGRLDDAAGFQRRAVDEARRARDWFDPEALLELTRRLELIEKARAAARARG